ncbi:MAG: NAD(P)-dependent oxidoreductase [Flavobacteriales bacterium]
MRILFADTAHPWLKEQLEYTGFECYYDENLIREQALHIIGNFDGLIIRSRFKTDREMIDAALPRLKFIARVGAGMENIDVDYATTKGIACLHAPEGNRNAVAEQALAMLLLLMNNLLRADREVRQGIWRREENRGYELYGKTVGIIGFGNTGSEFAKRLAGFDVQVLAHDKYKTNFAHDYVKESSLDEIFQQADVVSLHLPLTEETYYYANAQFFGRFSKPIYFINTSRGKVLETQALVNALQQGKVAGAALDVLEYESLSFEQMTEMPEAFRYLAHSDQVVLSPHIAGWTHESNLKMAQILFHKITEYLAQK